LGESVIPLPTRAGEAKGESHAGRALGLDVAGILRYQLSVLDREDRLESGTGAWRESFLADRAERRATARESVLRSLQMATDARYFGILEALAGPGHLRTADLAERGGLDRLTLQERVSDLVSAGLVTKVPEADQVSITAGGAAVVELVREATTVAERDVEEGA
jgi:DNA-binding HxlR family transcriptional regulator